MLKSVKKCFNKSNFRAIIFGSTGSGKTHFVKNSLIPAVKDNFTAFMVITREFNRASYDQYFNENGLRHHIISTTLGNVLEPLLTISTAQGLNTTGELDDDGNPVYRDNILLIIDDLLSEKEMKTDAFLDAFLTYRHLNISLVLLSQITNDAINTRIKANTDYFVFFKLAGPMQNMFARQIIAWVYKCTTPNATDEEANTRATRLMIKYIDNAKYGFIMIDYANNRIY